MWRFFLVSLTVATGVRQRSSSGAKAAQPSDYTTVGRTTNTESFNPWFSDQPLSVTVGSWVIGQFVESPPVTPPPTQQALNVAAGCPEETLPSRLVLTAPSGCSSENRQIPWTTPTGGELVTTSEQCWTEGWSGGLTPQLQVNTTEKNEALSSVWIKPTLGTREFLIADCATITYKYMVREWLVSEAKSNPEACHRFGSCDGSIMVRWELTDENSGKILATMPFVPLFTNSYTLKDSDGNKIATMTKNGDWNPIQDKCPDGYQKQWNIEFSSGTTSSENGKVAALAEPDARWIVAAMVSEIVLRDEDREPSGFVASTACQTQTIVVSIVFLGVIVLLVIGLVALIRVNFYKRAATELLALEKLWLEPKPLIAS